MKYKLIILLFLGFALSTSGQNLITNGSFEELNNCPPNPSFPLNVIPGWYSPSWNTPDIFNACVTTQNLGNVPYAGQGFQYAKHGIGYAGGVEFFSNRDYITNRLTDTLKANQTYCLTLYINLGDNPFNSIAIDRFGIFFSPDSIYYNTYFELPVQPQIETPTGVFYNDTSGWTKVELQYFAQGGERYMTIGNFYTDSMTNTQQLDSLAYQGYYFFDDFSLEECKWNGIDESNINKVSIYPNPSAGAISIAYNLPNVKNAMFSLYTTSGQLLFNTPINTYKNSQTIETDMLENGVYLYGIKGAKGIIASGKLVLIK